MKRIFTCCLYFLSCGFLSAQLPPWNAKFVVYHPDGYTDTLWVGCDENATNGFDEGLDSLDNSFEYPISIGAFSPEVDAEFGLDNCVNLKSEILPFADVRQYTFYVVYDDEVTSEPVHIKWDSLDYLYEHDAYMIYQATLIAQTGYIYAIDNYNVNFFDRDSENPDYFDFFITNYIDLYSETTAFECEPTNNVVKVRLDVIFKDYSVDIEDASQLLSVKIYPNPAKDNILVNISEPALLKLVIRDIRGIEVFAETKYFADSDLLNIEALSVGFYFVEIINIKTQQVTTFSLIKL